MGQLAVTPLRRREITVPALAVASSRD
jgi:hypothetical protein